MHRFATSSLALMITCHAQVHWTSLNPDPSLLIWDEKDPQSALLAGPIKAGWLNVPLLQDPWIEEYEESPRLCLRVLMKPARIQPARLGPILLHCGGPGSDARCAEQMGRMWFELNSTVLGGAPLSDDYDYWSISQRGMNQDIYMQEWITPCPFKDKKGNAIPKWPRISSCSGIDGLVASKGVEEVLNRMNGNPDMKTWEMIQEIRKGPRPQTFGNIFYNETYVRWAYRILALDMNLCYHDSKFQMESPYSGRSLNLNDHTGTSYLARDIEVFRQAIGSEKMNIYGVSYGTKVGSVYATEFPDKVQRLILDGDMGADADIEDFAGWVGKSTEEVWNGIAASCDNSVMAGGPPQTTCLAGPGVNSKFLKIFKHAVTDKEKENALAWFTSASAVIYHPGAPCAHALMKCTEDLYTNESNSSCWFSGWNCRKMPPPGTQSLSYPGVGSNILGTIGAVLGLDLAGKLTEDGVVEWWRRTKDAQPIGITRSLMMTIAVAVWPAIPRPQPPAGDAVVAPLVIGNLHDGQTPYRNAQRMVEAFPSGRLLTTQFYGHGMQGPGNIDAVARRYADELKRGVTPTYDDNVAKLLCLKVALTYLRHGPSTGLRDHICKAAGPIPTGPGNLSSSPSTLPWLLTPAGPTLSEVAAATIHNLSDATRNSVFVV